MHVPPRLREYKQKELQHNLKIGLLVADLLITMIVLTHNDYIDQPKMLLTKTKISILNIWIGLSLQ